MIYEWVKNNIETEWYWGCMKGAEESLRQKSGNDCDQATVLVALLRASGFPARYVRGVIEFFPDIDKAKNLTGIEDERELAAFFQKAGIPCTPVIAGGGIANFHIEHIWVETQVPYANYRGVIIDEHGKTWLGLDTSIKVAEYTYSEPEEIPEEISLSEIRDTYLESVHDDTPLEYLRAEIEDWLDQNQPDTAYDDLIATKTLVAEEMKILPASLQFRQVTVTHEYTEIPDELFHKVRFIATTRNTQHATGNLFDITLEAYKLSNKPVTVTYEPETVEDQEIMNSYGGLDNTPSYLVRLRPVLKVDGERLAVGQDGLPMDGEYVLAIELISPNGTERVTNTHIIGNLSVMGMVSQRAVAPEEVPHEDKDAERLLYEEVISYIDRWNQAEEELASLLRLSIARPVPTVVTMGGVIDVTYLLDLPHGFEWKGVYVDADLRTIEVSSSIQDQASSIKASFMKLSSLHGSILENRVLEDDFQVESISTAKLFGLANTSGVQILTIDGTNIDDLLPTLPFDDNIKEDIANAVNQNSEIRIPKSEIVYEDWIGIGYIKENPDTGESGWMLSGEIAGGMTAWGADRWPEYYRARLENPFSEPPNEDPDAAFSIQKITATDMQKGSVGETLSEPLKVIVQDTERRPVKGAEVTFTIKAGGGEFGDGKTDITVTTDRRGIAEAQLTLGKHTSDNPTMWWESGHTYSQQVGENIVDAALSSGRAITAPFVAYGFPGEPSVMNKTHGDGQWRSILSFAGFISISIEDTYGNPISNLPVDFQVLAAIDTSQCTNPNQDTRPALLIARDDLCLSGIPSYGDCSTAGGSLQESSSSTGVSVHVILGGIPEGDYPIKATSGNLSQTFHLYTYAFGNCDGESEPSHQLSIKYVYPADQYGNNINAAKPGTSIPVKAKLYYLREGEEEKDVTIECDSGPVTCTKIVGTREYYVDTDFKASSVTFAGQQGTLDGAGIYTAMYTLEPGINNITISGTATIAIRKSFVSCSGCDIMDDYQLTRDVSATMQVYGVDIQTESTLIIPVNENGYVTEDYTITYEITPSEYQASTAYVVILKDGDPIVYIPSETQGEGFATISRGFQFDFNSTYEAEVVLNVGTGVEIRSEKIKLTVVNVEFIDDEPDYAGNDNEDSDNFFLRQDDDFKDLDIFYRILPNNLPVTDVKIYIYSEMDETDPIILQGQTVGSDFKTGDNLHVQWGDVRDASGNFRDAGFYRIKLKVSVDGISEPIKTSIDDADASLPGWQCPQDGLAIHDLVYKHRPEVYVGMGETVAPNGAVYPFSPGITGNYRLLRNNTWPFDDGPAWEEPPENYANFGEFPHPGPNFDSPSYEYPVLQASITNDPGGVEDHYIDIDDNNRGCGNPLAYPYLLHRSHPNDHSNYVFIQYWMYETSSHSPYHTSGVIGNSFTHEADWEMVQIAVRLKNSNSPDNKAEWISPWAATAAQHYYGQTLPWRLDRDGPAIRDQSYVRIAENDPNRIRIYIAENSHATYFRDDEIDATVSTGVGTQVQYTEVDLYYDRILGPILRDCKLLSLEHKDRAGIYDWPGRWGEKPFNPIIGVLRGPLYRETWDKAGPSFRVNDDPVRFHNRCRKLIGGSPDPETELK